MQLVFATHNPNKAREVGALLAPAYEVVSLEEIGFGAIEETGGTIEENSLLKAREVFNQLKRPCFADDTGLEVQALDGQPGVHTARYAGTGLADDNIDLLLRNMCAVTDRSAQFKTVITYIDQKGTERQFIGLAHGIITEGRRGDKGFGYDPVFIPEGFNLTFAQMPLAEKNRISHRGKAVNQLVSFLLSK